jgi:cytochrome c553
MTRLKFFLTWIALAAMAQGAWAQDVAGLMLYRSRCANCHGQNGWGDEEKRVPAIAGLPAAYLLRQIDAFRRDLRKEARMHREAAGAPEGGDLAGVASVINAMTPLKPLKQGPADAENGAKIVRELCAECHGMRCEGKAERGAPPLTGFQSWYLADQVRHFRDFVRQGDPDSLDALRMHAIAYKTIGLEDVEDVAAFVASLTEENPGR